ncbi:secretory antigen SsaA-like protein [Staphylococcus phage Sa30]|nr:secretory antigen SsaA-like protein [Staphylococcus phage Sa30]
MRRIRRPKVRIEIVTDDNTFTLRFEDTRDYNGDEFGAKLLGFQTKTLWKMIVQFSK